MEYNDNSFSCIKNETKTIEFRLNDVVYLKKIYKYFDKNGGEYMSNKLIEGNALDWIYSRLKEADILIFFGSTIEKSMKIGCKS